MNIKITRGRFNGAYMKLTMMEGKQQALLTVDRMLNQHEAAHSIILDFTSLEQLHLFIGDMLHEMKHTNVEYTVETNYSNPS